MEKIDAQGADIMKANLAPQGVVPEPPIVEAPPVPVELPEIVETTPIPQNPFANPLAEKINSILKEGGNTNTIRQLIDLSEKDLTTMSPEDKIVMQYKNEYPDADEADIRAYMANEFGTEEERTASQKFALLKAGKNAEEFLSSKKINLETYQNEQKIQNEKAAQQQFQESINYWTPIVEKTFSPKIAVQEGDWGMEYNLPDEAKAAIQQSMLNFSVQLPKGGDSLKKVEAFGEHMVWATYGKKIMAAAIKDAVAKNTETLKRGSVSVPASSVPSLNTTPPTSPGSSMMQREKGRKF